MRRAISLVGVALLCVTMLPGDVVLGAPTCFGRAATIVGSDKKDVLEGTSGNDVIVGLAGGDSVKGMGGDDRICLGPGETVYYGRSPAARSTPFCHTGCAGPEYAWGGEGNDRIDGGRGDDQIHGGSGRDRLFGGKGDDFAAGGTGADEISLGKGRDGAVGGNGTDLIGGGPEGDLLGGISWSSLRRLTIPGGAQGELGNDRLLGGRGDDTLGLGAGDDLLRGGDGRDSAGWRKKGVDFLADLSRGIARGAGRDRLSGIENVGAYGTEDLLLVGTPGPNVLIGAVFMSSRKTTVFQGLGGNDLLMGSLDGGVDSRFFGGEGNDRMVATCGIEALEAQLFGGRGSDRIRASSCVAGSLAGGRGTDRLQGGLSLEGGMGNDDLLGDERANTLLGAAGNDQLVGGEGDDALDGGPGVNSNHGGPGTDTCINPSGGQGCEG